MRVAIRAGELSFTCPPDVERGSTEILGGLYGINYAFSQPPIILDIGANVGAYSVWADEVYPGCTIHAYEPHPSNFSYLEQNTKHINKISLYKRAVLDGQRWARKYAEGEKTVLLHDELHNCGEKSVYDLGEQKESGTMVEFMLASDLPKADIMKIDTEGCEPEILNYYGHLTDLTQVVLECHRKRDRYEIGYRLYSFGFHCVKDFVQVDSGPIFRSIMLFQKGKDLI